MNAPPSFMHELARRLLAASSASPSERPEGAASAHEAVVMCETLKVAVINFAGKDGFAALLRRSLVLARREAPVLESVRLGPDWRIEGLEEVAAGEGGAEAAVVLAAQVLKLLVNFIGTALTLHVVREGWPDITLEVEG